LEAKALKPAGIRAKNESLSFDLTLWNSMKTKASPKAGSTKADPAAGSALVELFSLRNWSSYG
jgi:hypothetical protein